MLSAVRGNETLKSESQTIQGNPEPKRGRIITVTAAKRTDRQRTHSKIPALGIAFQCIVSTASPSRSLCKVFQAVFSNLQQATRHSST